MVSQLANGQVYVQSVPNISGAVHDHDATELLNFLARHDLPDAVWRRAAGISRPLD